MDKEAIKEIIGNILELSNSVFSSAIPEEAKKHFRAACKEAMLGMIAIIDNASEKEKVHNENISTDSKKSSYIIDITE